MPSLWVGIFSYNEGNNLARLVESVSRQTSSYDTRILVLDDSDTVESQRVVSQVEQYQSVTVLRSDSGRRGKIARLNQLAKEFLDSGASVLLHFDTDLTLAADCIPRLIEVIEGGADVVGGVSVSLPGRNYFERATRLLVRPAELDGLLGREPVPNLGHRAAYRRNAVRAIFPIREDGSDEVIQVLAKCFDRRLRAHSAAGAVTRYRLISDLGEYVRVSKRVARMNKAAISRLTPPEKGYITQLSHEPRLDSVAKAIAEDPPAALLIPLVAIVRLGCRISSGSGPRGAWSASATSKDLEMR